MLSLYEAQVQVSSYIAGTQEQREEKRSLAALYSGVLWGAFMGILGNVFVSYFFAESTLINILGLTASGIACFVNACMLFIQVRKYSKPYFHNYFFA